MNQAEIAGTGLELGQEPAHQIEIADTLRIPSLAQTAITEAIGESYTMAIVNPAQVSLELDRHRHIQVVEHSTVNLHTNASVRHDE